MGTHPIFESDFDCLTELEMGLISVFTAVFALGSYGYAMYVLPCAAAGFLVNLSIKYETLTKYIPYNIDGEMESELSSAAVNNLLFLSLWAIAHSFMARPFFKSWWRQMLPESLERPFYVFQSAYFLHLLLRNWEPMPLVVYSLPLCLHSLIHCCYIFGYLFLLTSTFAIDHFELFGLRQGMAMGNFLRFVPDGLVQQAHYKLVRHPIMTGFFIMFWSVPIMTAGHLLFSVVATGYILIAVLCFEEPDLVKMVGPVYIKYMESTPAFCPFTK